MRSETEIITKPRGGWRVPPNLLDYEATRAAFTWEGARGELDGLPAGAGLNIAHEAVDRHALGPRRDHAALRCVDREARIRDYTYGQLKELTDRFANVLRSLGLAPGQTVCLLTGRTPELYIAALGALKNKSVVCPLFAAFGPEPLQTRLSLGRARALVTTDSLYRRKVEPLRSALPALEHVLVVTAGGEAPPGTHDFHALLAGAPADFVIPCTDGEDGALLHFTSGTTGTPKGAMHVHAAVVAHHVTGKYALDLHPGDIYWCTADPGWVTGTSYGIIAPLTVGATLVVDEEEFDAERWCRILQDQRVSVWYTAPTAVRLLMKVGAEHVYRYDTSSLRFMASVGEALNPEAVLWGQEAFGLPFHDNWWQTETGAIMISNYAAMDIKAGSMGKPVPGVEAAIVRRDRTGTVRVLGEGETGELALRAGWPSMFRGYLGEDARYRRSFADGWYLSGDLARRDEDGYFWFVGRADDVIKSAGHLIGPFEVESVLMEHPAVAEAGVIGVPDPLIAEAVKAFVVLKSGHLANAELERALRAHARRRLGAAVAPRSIAFAETLPKTRSGKIMRRLLKARELGLPQGDLSTLDEK
jgi:acetyl-CoA synthetase